MVPHQKQENMPHYDKFLDFHFDIYYQGSVKKKMVMCKSQLFLLLTENKNGKMTMMAIHMTVKL